MYFLNFIRNLTNVRNKHHNNIYEFNLLSKRDHVSLLYKRSFSDRKQLNLITLNFEPKMFERF